MLHSATCLVCDAAPRAIGLLCTTCVTGLPREGLCPEQIRAQRASPDNRCVNAWLLDAFGVPHTVTVDHERGLSSYATVGRAQANDVAIADATVSLRHAHLEHRQKSGAWFVIDQGSGNGTFVGDDRVERRFPLETGDRIFFGRRVGFVFLPLDEDTLERAQIALRWWRAQTREVPTLAHALPEEEERVLKVSAATEGGAVCSWGNERVQLSELEYELLLLLWRRWQADAGADDATRGFVPWSQLLESLSFHSDAPTHNNLRVLVRKVRRKLAECDPPVDIIESKKGLGYRVARELELS